MSEENKEIVEKTEIQQEGIKSEPPILDLINIYGTKKKINEMGIAGFILSLVNIFTWAIPGINLVIYMAGLILSIIGITKEPKGLAIAGLIISIICFLILMSGLLYLSTFF